MTRSLCESDLENRIWLPWPVPNWDGTRRELMSEDEEAVPAQHLLGLQGRMHEFGTFLCSSGLWRLQAPTPDRLIRSGPGIRGLWLTFCQIPETLLVMPQMVRAQEPLGWPS